MSQSGAKLEVEEKKDGKITYSPLVKVSAASAEMTTYLALLEFTGGEDSQGYFNDFARLYEMGIIFIILDYMEPEECGIKHDWYKGNTDTSIEETIRYLRFIIDEGDLPRLNYLLESADYLKLTLISELIQEAAQRGHFPIICRLLRFAHDQEEFSCVTDEEKQHPSIPQKTLLDLIREAILATCQYNQFLYFKMIVNRYQKKLPEIDPKHLLRLHIIVHCNKGIRTDPTPFTTYYNRVRPSPLALQLQNSSALFAPDDQRESSSSSENSALLSDNIPKTNSCCIYFRCLLEVSATIGGVILMLSTGSLSIILMGATVSVIGMSLFAYDHLRKDNSKSLEEGRKLTASPK